MFDTVYPLLPFYLSPITRARPPAPQLSVSGGSIEEGFIVTEIPYKRPHAYTIIRGHEKGSLGYMGKDG